MKIIIATDTYYPNVDGSSYFAQHLAVELQNRGHKILVIALSRTCHGEFFSHEGINIFGMASLPTILNKYYRFAPPFFIKKSMKKVIAKFRPDVIHIQGHFFVEKEAASIAKEMSIPLVGTNHFMPEILLHYLPKNKILEKWLRKFFWWQVKIFFKKPDIVTTPTKTAADINKSIGLNREIIPISCGINLNRFSPHNFGGYLRERYKLPDKPILLYVGRLSSEKNIDCVLKAFAAAILKNQAHLVIAGDGIEKKKLEELAGKLGISSFVTFTGFIPDDDLPCLYSLADIFVMASAVELQSLVTMEAMATGLPVIAVNASALPELVRHNENGYLFEPNNDVSLAGYMASLIADKNLRSLMGQKSLEFIQSHDILKTVGQFEEIYKTLTRHKIAR